MEPES